MRPRGGPFIGADETTAREGDGLMRVACFCGEQFEVDGTLAVCPRCGEPVDLPHASETTPPGRGRPAVGGWTTRLATSSEGRGETYGRDI